MRRPALLQPAQAGFAVLAPGFSLRRHPRSAACPSPRRAPLRGVPRSAACLALSGEPFRAFRGVSRPIRYPGSPRSRRQRHRSAAAPAAGLQGGGRNAVGRLDGAQASQAKALRWGEQARRGGLEEREPREGGTPRMGVKVPRAYARDDDWGEGRRRGGCAPAPALCGAPGHPPCSAPLSISPRRRASQRQRQASACGVALSARRGPLSAALSSSPRRRASLS